MTETLKAQANSNENDGTQDDVRGLELKDAYELYETGKHRRYSLLFSVNGGAFAIAKLLSENTHSRQFIFGHLTLTHLAVGMILFTCLMVTDIMLFSYKLHKRLMDVFTPAGIAVLFWVGAIICWGWFLAAIA